MDQFNNHEYYIARAASARQRAGQAASPAIASIHEEMAARYDSIIAQSERRTIHIGGEVQLA